MKKASEILLIVALILAIGLGVHYLVNHYGYTSYEWTVLINYDKYQLVGNSTLSGYVKASGFISVYIMTPGNFEKMKEGRQFSYYRAWEHVREVSFNGIKIPWGDYVLVVKNEEKSMQLISVEVVDRR